MRNRIFITLAVSLIASSALALTLAPNQVIIHVSGGLTGKAINTPTVSVTVCVPGTMRCQTVDNILLDTGSTGLRIYKSAHVGLNLPYVTSPAGKKIYESYYFAGGEADWGSVRVADVRMGGELAKNVPIQFNVRARSASSTSTRLSGEVNFNGIFGIGPTSAENEAGNFAECAGSKCAHIDRQNIPLLHRLGVYNPIDQFLVNNTGFSIEFPNVPAPAKSINGILTFGVNTTSNNRLAPSAPHFPAYGGNEICFIYYERFVPSVAIDTGTPRYMFPVNRDIRHCATSMGTDCGLEKIKFVLPSEPTLKHESVYLSFDDTDAPQYLVNPYRATAELKDQEPILGLPFFFGKRIVFEYSHNPQNGITGYISISRSNPADFQELDFTKIVR